MHLELPDLGRAQKDVERSRAGDEEAREAVRSATGHEIRPDETPERLEDELSQPDAPAGAPPRRHGGESGDAPEMIREVAVPVVGDPGAQAAHVARPLWPL